MPPESSARKYIAKRGVANRYNVVPRTVDRWVKAKILPPPAREINTRKYWDAASLDEHDRQQTAAAGAKGQVKSIPKEKTTNPAA
jgi:hypothetical protein